nr:unnamed protein product [Digitaria exilis]
MAPDGPYAWGYCFKEEVNAWSDYCQPDPRWPCIAGKKYYGRGPIQLSWNYNYGQAGEAEAIAADLLSDPDMVARDPLSPKPSCHDVMTGQWTPTPNDIAAGRLPGYGVTTNIINGGLECGFGGPDARVESRIGFYKRYCDLFGVSYGDNLDCYNQRNFAAAASSASATSSSYHADA